MKSDASNLVSHYDSSHVSEDVRRALGRQGSAKANRVRSVANQEPSPAPTWEQHVEQMKAK